MDSTVPITIGGRELNLRLDLWAMRLAERECPGLDLLVGDGWDAVSRSADAMLAVIWACLYHETPRPSVKELGMLLTPANCRR